MVVASISLGGMVLASISLGGMVVVSISLGEMIDNKSIEFLFFGILLDVLLAKELLHAVPMVEADGLKWDQNGCYEREYCKEKSGRVNEDRENFNLLAKGMRFSYRIKRPRKVVCRQRSVPKEIKNISSIVERPGDLPTTSVRKCADTRKPPCKYLADLRDVFVKKKSELYKPPLRLYTTFQKY
ncbi:hypothetical protein OUZ56_026009 [Daphnia magna]|uniref:Uncharacterized protein n=1 Tax=Daphnia magna TaxID=35525 RepID=A0ABQ9ZKK3_9CRUS|nr:hypothetical protein OUZ56_026009 [Daphnia magna]